MSKPATETSPRTPVGWTPHKPSQQKEKETNIKVYAIALAIFTTIASFSVCTQFTAIAVTILCWSLALQYSFLFESDKASQKLYFNS